MEIDEIMDMCMNACARVWIGYTRRNSRARVTVTTATEKKQKHQCERLVSDWLKDPPRAWNFWSLIL